MALSLQPAATSAKPLRVMVLDDDPLFRVALTRLLRGIGIEVVGGCSNLESARKRMAGGDVDAVSVDVVLKDGESGIDFLRWLSLHHQDVLAVLVTGTERDSQGCIDGMLLGAEVVSKPDARGVAGFEAELRRVFQAPAAALKIAEPAQAPSFPLAQMKRRELLAIGASTGGPPILVKVLSALPRGFQVPVVVTQHMSAQHMPLLAELLGAKVGRRVVVARDGESLQAGTVYLAGNGRHLIVHRTAAGLELQTSDGPEEHFCKPSVDPMFRSVAKSCPQGAVGVVLTGMGADGANGAVTMRAAGNPVLVQDKASSIVWGMPGAVVARGAADEVVPGDRMAAAIVEWMGWQGVPR